MCRSPAQEENQMREEQTCEETWMVSARAVCVNKQKCRKLVLE